MIALSTLDSDGPVTPAKVIKAKVGLLELAKQLSSVTQACWVPCRAVCQREAPTRSSLTDRSLDRRPSTRPCQQIAPATTSGHPLTHAIIRALVNIT
jgi:hypothetical protein